MAFTTVIAIIFDLVFPVALGIWFVRRYHTRWALLGVGALAFLASQAVHVPVLAGLTALFQNHTLPNPPPGWNLAFNAVLLGLLAGLAEETARWAAYRLLGSRARTWNEGVTLGIGHGGIECLIIGLSVLAGFITMQTLSQLAPQNLPAGMTASQISAYFAIPWSTPLAGILERLTAMVMHVTLSVLVLQTFLRRTLWYFWLAVLWHAFSDGFGAVALPGMGYDVWTVEGFFVLLALVNVGILYLLSRPPRQRPNREATPVQG